MTIFELHILLTSLIEQGKGNAPIYFDTVEARTFNYHMAKIGSAFFEESPEEHLGLYE